MKFIPAEPGTRVIGRGLLALPGAGAALLSMSAEAQAHAFGARYDLPLPLAFYLVGAGAAVALSFVIMVLAFRARPGQADAPAFDLLAVAPLRLLLHPGLIAAVQVFSVGLFFLILAAGFFGRQDTVRNIAPTFVWIIWWVGLAYVAALIGNIWPVINPWSILFAWFERLARRFGMGDRLSLGLAYPPWLGAWPAAVMFGLFAWFELIGEAATAPRALASAILVYSAVTWLAMTAFGRTVWLAHGDAFSLAFAVLGRFAPIGVPARDQPNGPPRHWYLRPYASALIPSSPRRLSVTAFVIVLLSTVTFDGVKETPAWGVLLQWIATTPALQESIRALHDLGFDLVRALETLAFVSFPPLFLLVYLGFAWLTKRAAGSARPVGEIAGFFVLSLVPIAIAYHLAHYLSYLLLAGQHIIPLASDPFGFGWDIFGTGDYRIDIGLIGAKFVWYAAVLAIVVGHVFAIGVAHFVALRVFEPASAARRSQYPLLGLMVGYTMVSLWILSQPIVGSPSLSTLRAPSDTVSLAPFEFREYCLDLAGGEVVGYDFRADGPIDFDIHYHEGLSIRIPVASPGATAQAAQFAAPDKQSYCLMWFNRNLTPTSLTYGISPP